MRVTVDVSGDLRELVEEQLGEVAGRLQGAVRGVAQRAQAGFRSQVRAAGLGAGLDKAWQRDDYPKQAGRRRSLGPASVVVSKSTVLHAAFSDGPAVLPRRGSFLVLPLAGAVRRGFDKGDVNRKGGAVPGGQKRKYSRLQDAADALGADVVSPRRGGGVRGAGGRYQGSRDTRPQIVLLPSSRRPGALLAVLRRPGERTGGEALFLLLRATKVPKLLSLETVRREAEGELRAAVTAALAG